MSLTLPRQRRAPGVHSSRGQQLLRELAEQRAENTRLALENRELERRLDAAERRLSAVTTQRDHAAKARDGLQDALDEAAKANATLDRQVRELRADRANRRAVTIQPGSTVPLGHADVPTVATPVLDPAATQPIPVLPRPDQPHPDDPITPARHLAQRAVHPVPAIPPTPKTPHSPGSANPAVWVPKPEETP